MIGIIGLGYVGFPLAVEFSKILPVTGFDINKSRVLDLKNGIDKTLEVSKKEFSKARHLTLTSDINDLKSCKYFIITVPTPVNMNNRPDLTFLKNATELVAGILKKGDLVIYESTVYPGATEEFCVPILESQSKLVFNKDFYCGYSPERVNPGDKKNRISNIIKITSGSTPKALELVDNLYKKIIKAGTYPVDSIKIAEAAKIIENTQRDLNIALMNELSLLFDRLGIDTASVLRAAETKWNFLKFYPGLVGGHCIGVDPYYLVHKAQDVKFHPELIIAGRKLNDGMHIHIASKLIKKMINLGISPPKSKILIMGLTFKENCPDTRNSRVFDLIEELLLYGVSLDLYDPWVENEKINITSKIYKVDKIKSSNYDAVVISVGHTIFKELGIKKIRKFTKGKSVIFDIKSLFSDKDLLRL
jgi:nucleotide sugar dehydrogenase